MIVVDGTFTTNTAKNSRLVMGKIEIDWDLNGTLTDESDNQLILEVERKVNEPLGGVSVGMADIELSNTNDRYTPPIT